MKILNLNWKIYIKSLATIAIFVTILMLPVGCSTVRHNKSEQLLEKDTKDSWHIKMLEAEMVRNPEAWMLDFERIVKWNYQHGLILMVAMDIWERTGDQRYFDWIKEYYDTLIDSTGRITHNYRMENWNIDHLKPGINLFELYRITGDPRYSTALNTIIEQLKNQPRTKGGGFWHKGIYPYQLWLDGVYMGAPFYARYSLVWRERDNFDDIVNWIAQMERVTRCEETGLLFHAYDESRQEAWADPQTGRSSHFWGRAMGWYLMGLVDVLDYFPLDHPGEDVIVAILQRLVDAMIPYQCPETGLWWQVVNMQGREGNYREGSVTAMFAYTVAKAVNEQLLDESYMVYAQRAFQGILDYLVSFDENGHIHFNQIVSVAGLGGNPYRDGSFEYYISEPIRPNDPKGVGPFMKASMEFERAGIRLTKNEVDPELLERVLVQP